MATLRCVCEIIPWDLIFDQRETWAVRLNALLQGWRERCPLCSLLFGSLLVQSDFPGATPIRPGCPCLTSGLLILTGKLEEALLYVKVICNKDEREHINRLALSKMAHNVMLNYKEELREVKNRRRAGPELVGLGPEGLAKAWIQDCVENHRFCYAPKDAPLPTRLLDVGCNSNLGDDIRLVRTKGMTGMWTALSYCWGNTNNVRTTTQTLDEHVRGISLDKLPRTIRDAVTVNRKLGIRYLWVDALCIIQDSEQDWETEAETMMDVFRHSYITIAANSGSDAHSGLSLERNPFESIPSRIKFQKSDGKTVIRWINPPRTNWKDVIQCSPLWSRGWTLQETTLATRVIYFDYKGLFWQCREGVRQERVPAVLVTANDPLVPRRLFDAYNEEPMNIFTLWCDIVQEFTSRTLTYDTDKLRALSGLSSAVVAFIESRSRRRLATPEEKAYYSPPKQPTHWAIPQLDEASKYVGHDGGNASFQSILAREELAAGKPIYTYTRGPLSVDPFLTMRFFSKLEPGTDERFINPEGRVKEIFEEVGLRPLLEFTSNTDNPDYDDEYIIIMSHQDTHAAYQKAYRIWEAELMQERGENPHDRPGQIINVGRILRPQGHLAVYRFTNGRHKENSIETVPTNFDAQIAVSAPGVLLEPDDETAPTQATQVAMYVYDGSGPVKAVMEWPYYGMGVQYLAGLWRADLLYGLQWYCPAPGQRASQYRAPTWSWASMDGTKVCYERTTGSYLRGEHDSWDSKWLAKVLDVSTVPRGSNRFGDVKSARLTLFAPVREMPYYTDVDGSDGDGDKLTASSPSRCSFQASLATKSEPVNTLPVTRSLVLDEKPAFLSPSCKVVLLDDTSCLVVAPVSGTPDASVFRRVGYWKCPRNTDVVPLCGQEGLRGWKNKTVTLI